MSAPLMTHFHSAAMDTAEMVKLIERLMVDYARKKTLHLSWDAAYCHDSKQLRKFIDKHNDESPDAAS